MIFRSTQISTAKQCIAKSYFKYHLGLRKIGSGKTIDLSFGSAVHDAIEMMHKDSYEEAVKFLSMIDIPFSGAKTRGIAKTLLNLFRMKFTDKMLFSEESFELVLDDDITLKGRFDFIAEAKSGPYVGEIKTTMPYYLNFKPNDQFISYFIAGKKLFGTDRIVIYNLDPNSVELNLTLVSYTRGEIEEWKEEMKAFLGFYQSCVDSGVVVRNPGSCFGYGRRCEFIQICGSSPTSRQSIIDNLFEVDEEAKNLSW